MVVSFSSLKSSWDKTIFCPSDNKRSKSADFVGSAPTSDGSLKCKSGQAVYTRSHSDRYGATYR